jgi:hypothetical protein
MGDIDMTVQQYLDALQELQDATHFNGYAERIFKIRLALLAAVADADEVLR